MCLVADTRPCPHPFDHLLDVVDAHGLGGGVPVDVEASPCAGQREGGVAAEGLRQ
jgi:hypothetical protein